MDIENLVEVNPRKLSGTPVFSCTRVPIKNLFDYLENGDLLKAATGVYEVLITVDRNIPYQQRITNLPIAVLILVAKRNKYEHLKPLIPRALQALETITWPSGRNRNPQLNRGHL